jgi:hypothetical protein
MSRSFSPVYSSTSDGSDLTLCRILETTGQLSQYASVIGAGYNKFYHNISAASTNATLVQTGATVVGMLSIFHVGNGNNNRFVKIYNHADTPSNGDVPILTFCIYPGDSFYTAIPNGLYCSNGLGFKFTANYADNDNTAISANELVINIAYV